MLLQADFNYFMPQIMLCANCSFILVEGRRMSSLLQLDITKSMFWKEEQIHVQKF
jgi:hypothetical protein